MIVNPQWSGEKAFSQITEKMFKHFLQEQKDSMTSSYTIKTHSLFIAPIKDTNEGLWVKDDELLEDFDVLNQVF